MKFQKVEETEAGPLTRVARSVTASSPATEEEKAEETSRTLSTGLTKTQLPFIAGAK